MADKSSKLPPNTVGKPVPMKLFATWEVDRTPPNCIPRLCSLTLTRLIVLRPLGADLSSITIAVKMQSSKRILRSNEMLLPTSGLLDTELDLHFALQYPHFIKRDGNRLHVMLQRRKRYKNRTILGFKTLAEGVVNMSQVLQRQMDLELDLLTEGKEGKPGGLTARITVNCLTSQPVDHKHFFTDPTDRVGEYSDEDEEFASSQDEGEGEIEGGSDSEPMLDDAARRNRKAQRGKIPANARQRNLKQKFIALLKRFRQTEGQEDIGRKLSGGDMDPTEIEDLFEELEDLSDSGPERDTMSISSTPKPSLRPFFASSKSLLLQDNLIVPGMIEESVLGWEANTDGTEKCQDRMSDESSKGRGGDSDSHPENWTDQEISDPQPPSSPPPKSEKEQQERKNRLFHRDRPPTKPPKKSLSEHRTLTAPCLLLDSTVSDRKLLMEQIARILPSDDTVPDHIILVSTSDPAGQLFVTRLQDRQMKVLPIHSSSDVRPLLTTLVNKIQKFCNSNAKPPTTIKIMTVGNDAFLNSVLRQYVDQLSLKPPDWQNYIKFLVVPLGNSTLSRYLCSVDSVYASSFGGDTWRDITEQQINEAVLRIGRYMVNGSVTLFLPVAEAMLTCKEKNSDGESSQVFVPFVNDVRLGSADCSATASVDMDESAAPPGSSPPKITPPSSPVNLTTQQPRDSLLVEPLELQIDYWTSGKTSELKDLKSKDTNKSTIKTSFKSLQVQRLPLSGEQPAQCFIMSYCTKEKKQKIMRLGKKKEKERETEVKNQQVDGVSRLICSAKTHTLPLKVNIDGTEWTGVKFFQLSPQWQTHIKTFPVALFSTDTS